MVYMNFAHGRKDARGNKGTCPSHSCAHLFPFLSLRASCPFRGYRETSREIKGDGRARGGKRKATPSRILSQLALLATRNGELAHSYPFPSRSNACRAGYIVRKSVKKALSQSLFGMPDCVTYTLRSYKRGDPVRAPFVAFILGNRVVASSSIPHVSLFFNLKHCKMLLFFPGRFEEEFSTAN